MSASGLLDCAPFRRDSLLFCLPLFSSARVDRARQMRNLRPLCADFAFTRFRVRINATVYMFCGGKEMTTNKGTNFVSSIFAEFCLPRRNRGFAPVDIYSSGRRNQLRPIL
jgi:hypothetical protein